MKECKLIALAMFTVAIAVAVPGLAAPASQQDERAVRQANEEFYKALNAMFQGEIDPMFAVWSHARDVTYMGPDGMYVVGWNEVSANWQKQANMKLGGTVRPEEIHTTIGEDVATVECFEVGENFANGKPQMVKIRATNVFRKENGNWKMIGHHTDKLPFLDQ